MKIFRFNFDKTSLQGGEYRNIHTGCQWLHDALIDIVEPLGFEREIDATIGKQNIWARLDLTTTAGEGDVINLCFDLDRVHLFDPETGRNLMCDAAFEKGC